ncbi:MAG: methionyl-tRNA formyltransferase [Thermoanaerobaculia bacterium]
MFFGTPEFAVPILEALTRAGRRPALVVTQPSRPVGRQRTLQRPPAAEWALATGVDLRQPERADDPELLDALRSLAPGWGIVAAYGEILKPELLAIPAHGFLNVHASLLPAWRGASPIQAALAAGEAVTGVTIMQVEPGLDTGPIVLQCETPIEPHETAPELSARLSVLGGAALVEALAGLERGDLRGRAQDETRATWAPRLKRTDGDVTWELPAAVLFNRWRAYQPWPGVRAPVRGESVKLDALRPVADDSSAEPGRLLAVGEESVTVACGEGSVLQVGGLQRPGSRLLPAPDVLRGLRIAAGDSLT